MNTRRLYIIGLIFSIAYLLYGVVYLFESIRFDRGPIVAEKHTERTKIPDIKRYMLIAENIKIRHDLFGKTQRPESRLKKTVLKSEVETEQPKKLSLKGIIVTPEGQFRAVIKPDDSIPVTLTVGDEIEGYMVQSITMTEVMLTRGSDTLKLRLYKKSSEER